MNLPSHIPVRGGLTDILVAYLYRCLHSIDGEEGN